LEKRRYPRYQLAIPLIGIVEHKGERCSGSVLNISVGGFYLHLSKPPLGSLVTQGTSDYGEIHYAGRSASGFGNLVRVETLAKGVGVGFAWDKNEMNESSSQLIAEIIKEQENKRALGRVAISAADIVLGGHVSSALANDVFACLRTIGVGRARLSLDGCTSIDSSGIEMLLTFRDRGVPVVNVGAEIERVIQRFQLSESDTARKSSDAG
jgi:hypothetical protein